MSKRINDLAKQALEESNGNWHSAAKLMEFWLSTNQELREELLQPFLSKAVWDTVKACARLERKPYFNTPLEELKFAQVHSDTEGISHVSNRSWHNYPLQGGLKLGEAKYEDLRDAYEFHQKLADDNAFKARWLSAIASKIQGTNFKVAEIVSEEDIGRIAEEVK